MDRIHRNVAPGLRVRRGLEQSAHNKNLFVYRDDRIERYRVNPRHRNATSVIEHSVFSDDFYELLPICMEIVKGPFELLSAEYRLGDDFYDRSERSIIFSFLMDDGEQISIVFPNHMKNTFLKQRGPQVAAEFVEERLLRFIQDERRKV